MAFLPEIQLIQPIAHLLASINVPVLLAQRYSEGSQPTSGNLGEFKSFDEGYQSIPPPTDHEAFEAYQDSSGGFEPHMRSGSFRIDDDLPQLVDAGESTRPHDESFVAVELMRTGVRSFYVDESGAMLGDQMMTDQTPSVEAPLPDPVDVAEADAMSMAAFEMDHDGTDMFDLPPAQESAGAFATAGVAETAASDAFGSIGVNLFGFDIDATSTPEGWYLPDLSTIGSISSIPASTEESSYTGWGNWGANGWGAWGSGWY